ncbi:MAG: helix-turn-helix transcriptional regulator [Candidatus Limnocylindrales bacterium]
MLHELIAELRRSRVAAGLSQAELGRLAGMSAAAVGRLERDAIADPGIFSVAKLLSIVGLELRMRAYPRGSPRRDRAHATLLERLRVRLHASFEWRTEVPFPNVSDPRSWDAMARLPQVRIGIEGETRGRDGQELHRRMAAKRRDGGVDRMVLLLADTRSSRLFLREIAQEFRHDFPVPGRAAVRALAEGRDPGGDAIILL